MDESDQLWDMDFLRVVRAHVRSQIGAPGVAPATN